MTDQIQQILQIPNLLQLKEKVLKLILKMLKQLDFDLASQHTLFPVIME